MEFSRETLASLEKNATKLMEYKNLAAELDKEIKELEDAIKAEVGDCEEVIFAGDRKISWKSSSATTVDSKALKSAEPEIFALYSKTSVRRPLLVK